ncbi:hypothetical protein [Fibrobacter sp.]|uniref:hypothetical protein n=1 Tax=Fibrobacter sp. TaxID=35828 RepID=UPI00388E71BA
MESKQVNQKGFMQLFKKLTAIPYLLVLVALLMPMANVSCDDDVVVAEPTLYKVASGMDLEQELKEPALGILNKMQTGNPSAMQKFRQTMPNFPKMEPVPFLYAILIGAVLAGVFALFTPLGSITMGMLTMVSMWFFLAQLGQLNSALGIPLLKVEPGVGIQAASFMILIGTAMNLASIIRPIVDEFKARRAAKKKAS